MEARTQPEPLRFLLFTKTNWDETPRLRHQVAELLASRGHPVVFFQRPIGPGIRPPAVAEAASERIRLARTRQLLHHQLRVGRILSGFNAVYEMRQIRAATATPPGEPFAVLNFNYDYYFLRAIFPGAPLVSFFNDDFIAGARLSRRQAARSIGLTSMASTHNLVVSYPLLDQIRRFTDRVSLFLPWARRDYVAPPVTTRPEDLLYWGYINDRIDYSAVAHVLSSGIRIHFVGPMADSARARSLVKRPNAAYHGVKTLAEMGPILARCAASILPYDATDSMVPAITINNRAFDLLACGLALLYADLPGLLSAPENIIYRCRTPDEYVRACQAARERFWSSQETIRAFLNLHTPETRYRQLMDLIERGENPAHRIAPDGLAARA